jgi:hypothetical protein
MYFGAYRVWDRFRNAPWQRIVRLGLVPVTMGLVIASGTVMARAADAGWRAAAVTIAATAITLATRLNPLWLLVEDFKSFADAMANKLAKEIDVADRSAVGRISSRPSK